MKREQSVTPAGLTIDQFAERYQVSRATAYRWSRQGKLKLTKIGPKATRILEQDEAAWRASWSDLHGDAA